MDGRICENKELAGRIDNVRNLGKNYAEAILVVKEYETIFRSKKEGILYTAFRQGKLIKELKSLRDLWKQ